MNANAASIHPSWERPCIMCNSPKVVQMCAGCECSHYCSAACQSADFQVHRILCKQFATFQIPPAHQTIAPKSSEYLEPGIGKFVRRGILFPVDEDMPRFVWVPTVAVRDGWNMTSAPPPTPGHQAAGHFELVHPIERYALFSIQSRGVHTIGRNAVRGGRGFDGCIFMYLHSPLDTRPNKSISRLFKDHMNDAPQYWTGNVLVLKYHVAQMLSPDIIMTDFRDVVDLLRTYLSYGTDRAGGWTFYFL